MFTEILIREVVESMITEGFPFDRLSRPQYKVKVQLAYHRDPGPLPVGRKGADPTQGHWDPAWNVLNHQTYDEFWEERNRDFKNIKCRVFSIGILHKVGIHLRGNLRGYEGVETPKKVMLCHGDFEGGKVTIFESIEMRNLLLRWYDHWLKGNDTGIMDETAPNTFVRGRERLDLANADSNTLDFGGHYYGLKVGSDTIYFDRKRPSHLILR